MSWRKMTASRQTVVRMIQPYRRESLCQPLRNMARERPVMYAQPSPIMPSTPRRNSYCGIPLKVCHNTRMSLMAEIRAFQVPRGAVASWWLGQNSFLFKSPEGTVVSTDLYLTNSCVQVAPPGMDFNRKVPVQIAPGEVDVDVYCCTHSYQDHADPETIEGLRHKDAGHFVGPHPVCDVYRKHRIESGRIVPAWPDCELELRDVKI